MCLDATIALSDVARLNDLAADLVPYIDSVIAHHDECPEKSPKWMELHAAVDCLWDVWHRYNWLLNQLDVHRVDDVAELAISDELQDLFAMHAASRRDAGM